MAEIIPAILPKNYEDLKNKLALVRGAVDLVQIDICDGNFVPSVTWPFSEGSQIEDHFHKIQNEDEGMPFWEDLDFELDLMVSDAVENFDIYAKLGAKRIIFHTEAVGNLEDFKHFLEAIDPYIKDNLDIGLAIGLNTPLENTNSLINQVDFVQVMGILEVGHQGEEFNEKALEYVKTLREKFSDLEISVDGGVNLENSKELIVAGATRLVVGSAIFKSADIIDTIREFQSL